MKLTSMMDLYVMELKDIYNAEKQLLKALPKMAKAAASEPLSRAFTDHLDETRVQVQRLEQIFSDMGKKPTGKPCEAMQGLVAEGAEMIEAEGDEDVIDAGLIVAGQKVEHYEIASYGSACAFAKMLGRRDDLRLLQETLNEEKKADALLTELAEGLINREALV